MTEVVETNSAPTALHQEGWSDALLGFLYPNRCQICDFSPALASEGYVCQDCRRGPDGVRVIEPPFCRHCGLPFEGEINVEFGCSNCRDQFLLFSSARASVLATDLLLDCVHRYKYNRALWMEPFLVELLLKVAVPALANQSWDALVPVPLHRVRLREREFNQAERLGAALSRATGIPLNVGALKRVKVTDSQTALSRTERAANMKHAFEVPSKVRFTGQRLLLVDDILTTGATASACAGTLLAAGAGEVGVWTLARARRHTQQN